mmetsp:Transcript_3200/g.9764  ORF Transcript_3200/g.9764 Transcript_3200/m.9764 type:complete len:203 (+) Transcript_3200:158-766(+)
MDFMNPAFALGSGDLLEENFGINMQFDFSEVMPAIEPECRLEYNLPDMEESPAVGQPMCQTLLAGLSFPPEQFFVPSGGNVPCENLCQSVTDDPINAAKEQARVAHGQEFHKRKQNRHVALTKSIKRPLKSKEEVSYIRRLVCNRDSAAARRKKDIVYMEALCMELQKLEMEAEALKAKYDVMRYQQIGHRDVEKYAPADAA